MGKGGGGEREAGSKNAAKGKGHVVPLSQSPAPSSVLRTCVANTDSNFSELLQNFRVHKAPFENGFG